MHSSSRISIRPSRSTGKQKMNENEEEGRGEEDEKKVVHRNEASVKQQVMCNCSGNTSRSTQDRSRQEIKKYRK